MRKNVRDVLIEARALLARRGGWIQGQYALNKQGKKVFSKSDDACQFCMEGAIRRISPSNSFSSKIFNFVEGFLSGDTCASFNDAPGRLKREVLALLDRAIERRRKGAGA